MGYKTTASGNQSTTMGYQTTASGANSTAMGYNTIAAGTTSTAIGYYNNTTDALFVIGNGTISDRSDAFKVDSDGNVTASGTISGSTFKGNGSELTGLPTLKMFNYLKKENKTLRNELNALKAHLGL